MRSLRSVLPALLSCAFVASAAPVSLHAQQQTLQLDPATSQVQFALEATFHAVHGTFHVDRGTITFDPAKSQINGLIEVDAHSGNSGEAARDKKMTQDELKADKFTSVTFAPKSYTGTLAPTGDSSIVVQGTFTLLGTPHDLTVPMHVHIDGTACSATGTFAVPFVRWGLKDPSTFMLKTGKDVNITLDLHGSLTAAH